MNATLFGHDDVGANPGTAEGPHQRVSNERDRLSYAHDRISGGLGLTTPNERSRFLTAELYVGWSPGHEAEIEVML